MNILEVFGLVMIMLVVFVLFGLIGIAILGVIIIIAMSYGSQKPKPHIKDSMVEGTNIKPCHAHGLIKCPYCYPKKPEEVKK